jgi:hypothetical protein
MRSERAMSRSLWLTSNRPVARIVGTVRVMLARCTMRGAGLAVGIVNAERRPVARPSPAGSEQATAGRAETKTQPGGFSPATRWLPRLRYTRMWQEDM